jgi:cysteine desulfurase
MIYFDNSATTKPYREVLDTFVKVSTSYFGNPSSIHQLGGESETLLTQARQAIARLMRVEEQEIIFTAGGTEGNNIAIKGVALEYKKRGKHLITTTIEHASSLETFKQLERLGFEVTYLPVNKEGLVDIDDIKSAIREDTILVSIIHVNNEIGTVQSIEEIGNLLKIYPKLFFHVDHVQGIGKVPLNIKKAHIDLLSCSGHKFHGLKGTGFLYKRSGFKLSPLLTGGGQESNIRAGTENVAGIVSMAKALRLFLENSKNHIQKLVEIKELLYEELLLIDGIIMNTPKGQSAPHIINFSVPGIKPEVLIHSLEKHQVYVSTKSACSSKQTEMSHVLLATGMDEERAKSGIRISLSFENTKEEAEQCLQAVKTELKKLKMIMG